MVSMYVVHDRVRLDRSLNCAAVMTAERSPLSVCTAAPSATTVTDSVEALLAAAIRPRGMRSDEVRLMFFFSGL
jgi:hypothetical protein